MPLMKTLRPRVVILCAVCGFVIALTWSGWLMTPPVSLPKVVWLKEGYKNLQGSFSLLLSGYPKLLRDSIPSLTFQEEDTQHPWKTILFWNSWFGENWTRRFGPTTGEGLREVGCPTWRCNFSYDRSIASTADAILFDAVGFSKKLRNMSRPLHQRWVWVAVESPISENGQQYTNILRTQHLNHLINWTMTYHSSSDIGAYYGHFLSLGARERPLRPNMMSEHGEALQRHRAALTRGDTLQDVMGDAWRTFVQRPRVAAFMTSHCHTLSKREEYVVELQKYVEVDRYGSCVKTPCGNRAKLATCWEDVLSGNYSFYMAMENSFCDEYATEKLYLALVNKMVPVVWGGSDYDTLLPPHSYINARHHHPQELAQLLLRLHQDPIAYGRYHLWRGYLEVVMGASLCELCHRLHQHEAPSHYHDVKGWYRRNGRCVYVPRGMFESDAWRKVINDTRTESTGSAGQHGSPAG